MLADLRFRLRALFRRRAMDGELDDELRFHLEQSIEAHLRAGQPRAEAERLARLELGGLEQVKEECRDARGVRPLHDLAADLRYGLRVLRRSPAFTVVAVLTLALGIGVNTAMFGLADAVLRQPLPYPHPGQLVRLHGNSPRFERGSVSYPNFTDWQSGNRTFAAMAVSRGGAFTLAGDGVGLAERVTAELVSSDWFTVLGVQPVVGRAFAPGEAEPGGQAIAVLGDRLWRQRFAADPAVVGRTIHLDGQPYVVIGVVPTSQDLRGIAGGTARDLYLPIGQFASEALKRRGAGLGIHGIGRLAPGVGLRAARADLAWVSDRLAKSYPETNASFSATIDPLRWSVFGDVRPYVLLLFGAVGLVLLIACVNVANLLLARAAGRARELGIRLAVGASRGRLIRQLLTESLLLGLVGGALGLLVAWWCRDTLFALPPGMPAAGPPHLDGRLLGFALAISIAAGVLAGLTPAVGATRVDVHAAVKSGGQGRRATRYRAQSVFVIAQTAMAFVLLVQAGLLVRTLRHLASADPGFSREGVVSFGVSLSPSLREEPPARVRAELERLRGALASAPGVVSAAFAADGLPLEVDDQLQFYRDGGDPDRRALGQRFVIGVDYLETMRIPLRRGRTFSPRDDDRVGRVAIIDDVFARTYFPGEDPVGQRIRINNYDFAPVEIIGVVGHVKQWGLDEDEVTAVRAQIYEPVLQVADDEVADLASGIFVVARTRGRPLAVAASLRAVIAGLGPDDVMYRVRTVAQIIDGYQATRRFAMVVLAAFAVLALALSCIGIYGVVSYIVAQRTKEIGIRMALGGRGADIMLMVLRQGTKLVAAGIALGLVGAVVASAYTDQLLYGVAANDPLTFVAVAAVLLLVAAAAVVLPARRAMRLDPMQALRID